MLAGFRDDIRRRVLVLNTTTADHNPLECRVYGLYLPPPQKDPFAATAWMGRGGEDMRCLVGSTERRQRIYTLNSRDMQTLLEY